jgi:hypothetical protein
MRINEELLVDNQLLTIHKFYLEQPSTKAKQVSNRVNDDTNLKENTPLL